MPTPTHVKYFRTPADLRAWFDQNHEKAREQWIGYYKKDSGKPSITWPESVDQALCFGWIDGVRKSIDAQRYAIRFTPRRPTSNWSAVNIRRIAELKKLGLMKKPGLELFKQRRKEKANRYSFEQRKNPELPAPLRKKFQANKKAWTFFTSQPPWYQRACLWWVISAKQETTTIKRLGQLIRDAENGKSIPSLTRKKK